LVAVEAELAELQAKLRTVVAERAKLAEQLRAWRKRVAEIRVEMEAEHQALDTRRRFWNAVEGASS
jgi:capsule polysaccharide export protein KpsE/RkpR